MKNYIVFDLEWNQSANGKERSVPHFPFEIIEIGAVKLNENFQMTGEFSPPRSVRRCTPRCTAISEVTHMNMKELRNSGELFPRPQPNFLPGAARMPCFAPGQHGSLRTAAEHGLLPHGESFFQIRFSTTMCRSSTAFSAVRTQESPLTLP